MMFGPSFFDYYSVALFFFLPLRLFRKNKIPFLYIPFLIERKIKVTIDEKYRQPGPLLHPRLFDSVPLEPILFL